MMQSLGRNYVRYINLTYQRTGTLWEGRFKSSIVDSEIYLLTVYRYIELNLVRANMVRLPGEYAWSSYRHNAMGIHIALINEHENYLKLGDTESSRLVNYRSLFDSEITKNSVDEIRKYSNKEWIIGSEKFKRQIESAKGRKVNDVNWGGDRKSKQFKSSALRLPQKNGRFNF
ncbi:hypothetical protein TDB9533_01324 [Thalassocella blandensis]|nr:hypothetical protein TDB9533_01324 [Thalassocella blandensis]